MTEEALKDLALNQIRCQPLRRSRVEKTHMQMHPNTGYVLVENTGATTWTGAVRGGRWIY